ncbi:MAG TPA: CHAT domain-containing protein, partial [Chloroflexi bacterium]|nr:CHAT domain-containing protein [Chloroflexota bacterium]
EQAVEALEAGRTRLLRETMEQNRRDLERLPALGFDRLHKRYQEARQRFRDLLAQGESPRRPADWPQQMKAAWEEVQAAEQAIREEAGAVYPEFAHFMEDPTFDQVLPAARDAPLVYLLATPAGGLALVVHGDGRGGPAGRPYGVTPVRLPGLTEEALNRRLWSPTPEEARRINDHLQQGRVAPEDIEAARGGYLSMYRLWRIGILDRRIPKKTKEALHAAWLQTLDETTRWLWEAVVGEVVETLTPTPAVGRGDRPVAPTGGQGEGVRVTLIPTGLLSLLPLHAAWREEPAAPTGRHYALDDLRITYAPSAHALWAARRIAAHTAPDGVFVVDNPDGTLRFSDEEVASVLEHFPPERQHLLGGESATREAVLRQLPRYPVLHFCTHGWADPDDPLRSGLRMAEPDHPLTLANFLDLRLEGARLAVLSACETAVPGTELPEEVIGLPTGLLQAGVAGVVGSLWAVNEISTALLMARFYDLWRGKGLAPPEALRQAQIWLRDSTNGEKEVLFRTALPELTATRLAEETARRAFWDMVLHRPGERDFAHPYYWAGFGYTGV